MENWIGIGVWIVMGAFIALVVRILIKRPEETRGHVPVLMVIGAFGAVIGGMLGVGIFERGQRVAMAQVASRTAHDLREAAVAGARSTNWDDPAQRADFITRIIGDTARIKADLKGILIHLLTNGLLLAGITVLLALASDLVVLPACLLIFRPRMSGRGATLE